MNPRERAVAVELFCSAAVQQQVAFGQFKVGGGEEGSFAALCGKAAKTFCEVAEAADQNPQVTAVALKVFAHMPGAVARIGGNDRREIALTAFRRAQEFLEALQGPETKAAQASAEAPAVEGEISSQGAEEPSSQADSEAAQGKLAQGEAAQGEAGEPVDVPTEKLDLPQKTIDLLLSLSSPEVDLTSARKIRAADAKQSIEALEHIGVAIRKKILEAVEKAIGPFAE